MTSRYQLLNTVRVAESPSNCLTCAVDTEHQANTHRTYTHYYTNSSCMQMESFVYYDFVLVYCLKFYRWFSFFRFFFFLIFFFFLFVSSVHGEHCANFHIHWSLHGRKQRFNIFASFFFLCEGKECTDWNTQRQQCSRSPFTSSR